MSKMNKLRSSMAVSIIGAIVLLLAVFSVIVSIIGLAGFTAALQREYNVTTYHIADTAATMINGDHVDEYLAGEETEEYRETREILDAYCRRIHVSLIYLIQVDTSDYGRFVSVFNLVDNSVGDTSYTEWELGYRRDTTNDEYRRKYKALYDQESEYETVYRTRDLNGAVPHITTMVPVKDSSGATSAILCIQRPIRELQETRQPFVVSIAVSTVLLAAAASIFSALYFKKHFVMPIRKVSEEAVRFARENTRGEELADISRYDELIRLADSINTMETDMVNYMESLTEITSEKERISTELSLATRIQLDSLPTVFPPFPDRHEFDIYASMEPAREVGGDFYDFFLIDDDHLYMAIADVSGKGIPAALFMMVSRIVLAHNARLGRSPGEILEETNTGLCDHNEEEMFVTVWVGILEISTGRLTAANAGHEYPVLKKPDGSFALLKDRHGLVLGAMEGSRYREYELILEPGTKLFLYTDGVPEATDAEGRLFGSERMLAALNEDPEATPETVLKNVRRAVDGFVQDAEQFDDLTMMCLEYSGRKQTEENI